MQARRLIHEHAGKNRGKDSWCTMGHNLMKRPAATLILLVDKGVSKNRDTSKSSILIGFSIIFTIHFRVPLFLETPIKPCSSFSMVLVGERQLYQQALSAFQRGEDENMAKICEAYMLAQEAMLGIFGCLVGRLGLRLLGFCHGLVKCCEAARTMEDNEAEGAFFFFWRGVVEIQGASE